MFYSVCLPKSRPTTVLCFVYPAASCLALMKQSSLDCDNGVGLLAIWRLFFDLQSTLFYLLPEQLLTDCSGLLPPTHPELTEARGLS